MRVALAIGLCALATSMARADAEAQDDQVVVVNAAAKLGDVGQISRVSRVLESRGMLFKLPKSLAATLDGRNVLVADVDAIKDAFANTDYATALKMIEADEQRILGGIAGGDPVPALAELCQWRGLIAAGLDNKEEAIRQFRAAYRFNPAWSPDRKLASPTVSKLVRQARREPIETGMLHVDADPETAMISVDGGERTTATSQTKLTVGIHLVMITAPDRKPYTELVDIRAKDPYKIAITLDKESTLDRAARLVDESAAAPPGKARLKRTRALAKLTGVKRFLFVEGGDDDHVTLRLYDVELKKVSKALDLEGSATSAAIARKVTAALDPDNLIDVTAVIVSADAAPAPKRWYEHWYVWAGVAALAGGSYFTYQYSTRAPTMVRF
ncbi:MAG: hypothetical protein JWO36_7461 [Myxococcales bacterium]|nr:hypothetical protein [Myxococcales bacterium]